MRISPSCLEVSYIWRISRLKYEGRHPRFFAEPGAECWQGKISVDKDLR